MCSQASNVAAMKKVVRDHHRRELASQMAGAVWLGGLLGYLSGMDSNEPIPTADKTAKATVALADALLDALEEREQSSV